MCVRSIYTAYLEQINRKARRSNGKDYNHGQKSWNTFAFLGRFPIHTGPTPPLTPQTTLDACFKGTIKNIKNMNIAVLSQGLLSLNPCFLKKSVFFTFSTLFRHFGDK